jgi:hypothetical protein
MKTNREVIIEKDTFYYRPMTNIHTNMKIDIFDRREKILARGE